MVTKYFQEPHHTVHIIASHVTHFILSNICTLENYDRFTYLNNYIPDTLSNPNEV